MSKTFFSGFKAGFKDVVWQTTTKRLKMFKKCIKDIKNICFLFGLILSCEAYDINDAEYERMPEIFALDNYDSCMRKTDGLYCLLKLELNGDPNNELFKQIKDYSKHRVKRFNHTHLDRGVCVPKICKFHTNQTKLNVKDLAPALGKCLNETIYNDYKLHANVLLIHNCDDVKEQRREYDYLDLLAATVVVGILTLNLVGSIMDKKYKKTEKDQGKPIDTNPITSFSVFRNWNKLCQQYQEKSKDISLQGFTGLRFIVLMIVIMSHVNYMAHTFVDNVNDFEKLHDTLLYKIIMYGFHIVQISFTLSGFLLGYKVVQYEDVSTLSWIDIPKILITRFIRLTPGYGFVLLLFVSWLRYIGSGPLWGWYVEGNIKACQQYYWHHIFYLNNYIFQNTCLLHTWYVAADVQVFTIGAAAICLTKKRRMLVLSALFVFGISGTIADILRLGVYPSAVVTPEWLRSINNDTFRLSHIRGHNNLPCFVVGVIMGIYVFKWQKSGFKIQNKMLHYLSNMLPIAFTALFLSNEWLHADGLEPTVLTKLLFAIAFRLALSAILAFMLIAIVMKFDSPLLRLLSWSGWAIPSRLAYSVYLIHMVLIILNIGMRTTKETLSLLRFVTSYVGITIVSFVLATMLYILVEAPCSNLVTRTKTGQINIRKGDSKSQ